MPVLCSHSKKEEERDPYTGRVLVLKKSIGMFLNEDFFFFFGIWLVNLYSRLG